MNEEGLLEASINVLFLRFLFPLECLQLQDLSSHFLIPRLLHEATMLLFSLMS